MANSAVTRTRKKATRRISALLREADASRLITDPPSGGGLRPLSATQEDDIVVAAFNILSEIGLSGMPAHLVRQATAHGARLRHDERICFPKAMVEDALSRAPIRVDLPGFQSSAGLTIGQGRVHIGTGGAAVQVLDGSDGSYRPSGLRDLYALMRVLDVCDNIHYGVRPVVARDLATPLDLDINTAFACLKATSKPIGISFDNAGHVRPVLDLFDAALGTADGFRANPFCLAVIVHVVPPLHYSDEGCATLETCLHQGMIPQICSAGQAGATSPVTLAGALAQGLAECLAGLVVVDMIKQASPCIYAFMPFVSDLRTGAMTGGGGESAIANAAAAQLLSGLGLPSTVSAGMTDAKTADVQAGYEKGYSVALAAQAGADMINLSVGMLASIMVASPEALLIDNDMCGAILRSVRGIETGADALDIDMIERVVCGDGHYLGEAQTLRRMKTDYVYPALGNRQTVDDWLAAEKPEIWDRARARVREILTKDQPTHLSRAAEAAIRAATPIHLPELSNPGGTSA